MTYVGDINGEFQDSGFSESQVTMDKGFRSGTFKSFAEKHVGNNLMLLTHSHVTKIVMEGKQLLGWRFYALDKLKDISLRKRLFSLLEPSGLLRF